MLHNSTYMLPQLRMQPAKLPCISYASLLSISTAAAAQICIKLLPKH